MTIRNQILLLGGGGHASDVVNVLNRLGMGAYIAGYLDDVVSERMKAWGVARLGGNDAPIGDASLLLGIGFPAQRRRVMERYQADTPISEAIVDPDASVAAHGLLDDGTVILAGARLSPHVVVGRHAYISQNTSLGHDVIAHDHVTVMPGANVSGGCEVGVGVLIGSGATVLPGLSIGENSVVGAGAVVTHDVPANVTVVGCPARPL